MKKALFDFEIAKNMALKGRPNGPELKSIIKMRYLS